MAESCVNGDYETLIYQREEDTTSSNGRETSLSNHLHCNKLLRDNVLSAENELWLSYQLWVTNYGSMRSEERQAMRAKVAAILELLTPVEYLSSWMWDIMIACIRDGNLWSPYEASLAFAHLEQYALNLAWFPWKQEIQLIHTNCGFFSTRVARVIADAVKVLEQLGYTETFQDIYTLENPMASESIHMVAFECFKAAAECSYQEKLLASFLKGNPHLSWEQKCEAARCVLKCRENGFSETEECFEAIWDDLRLMNVTCDSSPLGIKSLSHESLMPKHMSANGEFMAKYNHVAVLRHFDSRPSSTENLLTIHSDGSYRSSERPKLTAATFQPLAKPWQGIGDELSAELIKEKKTSKSSLIQYDEEIVDAPMTSRSKTKLNKGPLQSERSPSEKRKFKTLIERVAKRDSLEGHKVLQNVMKQFTNVGHKLTAINAKKRIGELLTAAENLRHTPNKRRTTWYTDADDIAETVSMKSEQELNEHVISSRSYATHGSLKLTKANSNKVASHTTDGLSLKCPRCHWSSVTCDGSNTSSAGVKQPTRVPPVPPPPAAWAKHGGKQTAHDNVVHRSHDQHMAKQLGRGLAADDDSKPAADALMDELVQKLALRRSKMDTTDMNTFNSFGKPTNSVESDNLINERVMHTLSLEQNSIQHVMRQDLLPLDCQNVSGVDADRSNDNDNVVPEACSPVNPVTLSRASSRLNALAGGLSAIAEDEEVHSGDGEVAMSDCESDVHTSIVTVVGCSYVSNAVAPDVLSDVANADDVQCEEASDAEQSVKSLRQCVRCSAEMDSTMCCMCCHEEMPGGDDRGCGNADHQHHLAADGCPQCPSCVPVCSRPANSSSLTPTLVQ